MRNVILVVEDDPRIAALVEKNLDAAGYACVLAHDGDVALVAFERERPVLVVLDLMLPGIGGLEITRHLRTFSDVPILMLTARSSESDKVLGLELGADDYLTKPFSTSELVARVRALLRRAMPGTPGKPIVCGELRIDPSTRDVERAGERISLTSLEFDLLHYLATRPGHVCSRETLMEQVWGNDRMVGDRSIDNLVSRLRRKLESNPDRPRHLQTVWGAGYRLSNDTA